MPPTTTYKDNRSLIHKAVAWMVFLIIAPPVLLALGLAIIIIMAAELIISAAKKFMKEMFRS